MKRWRIRARAAGSSGGATGQNVDSLLDTMANVVGILIVMMAVTQMTVNDAMKRIQVWETDEATSLRAERSGAEDALALSSGADLQQTLELSRLREHIEALREMDSVADTASVSAAVASQKLQIRRLQAKIADKRERVANLQIVLRESEALAEQKGIALRLPDPRPAPPGASRTVLLARHGRVFDPRFDQLTRELTEVRRRAKGPLDRYFEAYDVGNEMLRWQVIEPLAGRYRLSWRRNDIGETVQELRGSDAAFRHVLEFYDTTTHFLEFYVWSDSFPAYLEARRMAEQAGYSVGWIALPANSPLDLVKKTEGAVSPVD